MAVGHLLVESLLSFIGNLLMGLAFQCPQCGRRFRANESAQGKPYRCGCGQQFQIPTAPQGETSTVGSERAAGGPSSSPEPASGSAGQLARAASPNGQPAAGRALRWRVAVVCGGTALALIALVAVMLWNTWERDPSGPIDPSAPIGNPWLTPSPIEAPVNRTIGDHPLLGFELEKRIRHFAFSKDGRMLVTERFEPNPSEGVPGTEAALWDMTTGKQLRVVPWIVYRGKFSPNGKLFGTLHEGAIMVWNVGTGALHRQFRPVGIPFSGRVDFSADSEWISYPGTYQLALIHIETGVTRFSSEEDHLVGTATFFPDQPRVALGRWHRSSKSSWVELYDLDDEGMLTSAMKVNTPQAAPDHIAVSPDGKTLVAAAQKGDMAVFETKNWILRANLERKSPHKLSEYNSVLVSPDGAYVATIPGYSGRPKLELWSVATQEMREFGPEWCFDAAFLPDGTLAMATYQNGLLFFDLRTEQLVPPPRPLMVAAAPPPKDDGLAKLPSLERARAYRARGRFLEAIAAYMPLLAAAEKEHGGSHPRTLELVRALAECQRCAGNFAEAVERYRRCLTAIEATLQPSTVEVPSDAHELAHSLILSGNRREAIEVLQKTLSHRRERLGADHPAVAAAEHALGWLYSELGDDLAANEHYARGLQIRRRALPSPHADLAESLMMSGYSQGLLDQFDRAVPLLEQAVKMVQKLVGDADPRLAEAQARLGYTYVRMKDWEKARPWFDRSWTTLQKSTQETPAEVYALRQIGAYRAMRGWINEAEAIARRTLEVAGRVYGPKHVILAQIDADFAENYLYGGLRHQAFESQTRAIAAFRSFYGEEYPRRTEHLLRLAQSDSGAVEKSLQEIRKIGTPPTAEGRATEIAVALAYGRLHAEMKRPAEALAEFDRGVRGTHANIIEVLPILPDTHKHRFAQELSAGLALPLSAAVLYADQPAWLERAAEWTMNLKGLSDEVLGHQVLLERDAPNDALRRLAQELTEVRRQISALVIGGVNVEAVGERADQARQLLGRERELTVELGRSLPQLTPARSWTSLAQVRERLDPKSVLVEVVMAFQFDFRFARFRGEASYLAFVIPPKGQGNVQLIDLGELGQIWDGVEAYRDKLDETARVVLDEESGAAAMREMDKATGDLSALLVRKLQPAIDRYDRWLLGLDGALWLVPWAALKGNDGKLLVETKEIGYVTSGRVLAATPAKHATSAPVVVADPDFDHGVPAGTGGGAFAALMASAAEAEMVAPKIAKYAGVAPKVFTGDQASEATLKAQKNPRLLFLSTHGYYEEHAWGKHPLLRSGLALAGANGSVFAGGAGATPMAAAPQGATLTVPVLGAAPTVVDDGILTGLEAVSLDLRGTELVVLSACQSGQGELRAGQGVMGLRQAFHLAGADSVIAALWSISDGDTADLMGRFFDELSKGQRKTAALRRAQLRTIENMRTRRVPPHPHFWAAFILTGRDY